MTKSLSRSSRAAVAAGLAFAAVMAVGFLLLAAEPAPPTAAEPAVPTITPEVGAPAATLRDALLPKLVSGKIRLREVEGTVEMDMTDRPNRDTMR